MAYEIYIYGEIGPAFWGGIDEKYISDELAKAGGADVVVRLNTPGGYISVGHAIYNMLNRYKGKKIVEVDALAASAGSFIAMVGDEINIAENAMMMIHNGWGMTIGDKREHEKQVDLLEKLDGTIAATYSSRTGKSIQDVSALMDSETWFTAQEAIDAGFATSIGQKLKVKASVRQEMKDRENSIVASFKNMPTNLLDEPTEGQEPTPAMQFALNRFEADLKIRLAEKHVNAEVFAPMRSAAMKKINAIPII